MVSHSKRFKRQFTTMHLFGEWLMAASSGVATHVPFKGGTAPMMELLAGRVDVMIDTMTSRIPHPGGRRDPPAQPHRDRSQDRGPVISDRALLMRT